MNHLSIGLFDPGMTHIHRIGLAGLYMTLKNLGTGSRLDGIEYELGKNRVILNWSGNVKASFEKLST